jgi:hypothetical protein
MRVGIQLEDGVFGHGVGGYGVAEVSGGLTGRRGMFRPSTKVFLEWSP